MFAEGRGEKIEIEHARALAERRENCVFFYAPLLGTVAHRLDGVLNTLKRTEKEKEERRKRGETRKKESRFLRGAERLLGSRSPWQLRRDKIDAKRAGDYTINRWKKRKTKRERKRERRR